MATEFLQGLILLPITVLIAWLALRAAGGWSGLHELIAAQGLQSSFAIAKHPGVTAAEAFTWGWIGGMMVKNTITWNTLASASRYFAVKDGREARKAALIFVIGNIAGAVVWYMPPLVARLLYADQVNGTHLQKPAEAAYAIASLNLLPAGLIGLVIVAMLTSTMSSVSYGLNHMAAIVIKDVYPAACRFLGREAKIEAHLLGLSRITSFSLGLVIVGLALYYSSQKGTGVFEQMLSLGAYIGTPMAIPMFLGLFIRRVPAWTAMFSMSVSLLASVGAGVSPLLGGPKLVFQDVVFLTSGTGAIAFFACIPFWSKVPASYSQQVAGFFEKMHTPVDFEREVGRGNDLSQLRITGALALAAGALVLLLLFFAKGGAAQLQVAFVACTLLATGALLWLAGRRKAPRPTLE